MQLVKIFIKNALNKIHIFRTTGSPVVTITPSVPKPAPAVAPAGPISIKQLQQVLATVSPAPAAESTSQSKGEEKFIPKF